MMEFTIDNITGGYQIFDFGHSNDSSDDDNTSYVFNEN